MPAAVLEASRPPDIDVELALRGLPVRSAAPGGTALCESFRAFCERGLFVFDWSDVHRTVGALNAYELQARPEVMLRLRDLPLELERMASKARLDVSFETEMLIDPRPLMPCLDGLS